MARGLRTLFEVTVATPETATFMASHCTVITDSDGYWVHVITDDYEGHAMMTLPCAVKVRAALGKAIRAARDHRAKKLLQRADKSLLTTAQAAAAKGSRR